MTTGAPRLPKELVYLQLPLLLWNAILSEIPRPAPHPGATLEILFGVAPRNSPNRFFGYPCHKERYLRQNKQKKTSISPSKPHSSHPTDHHQGVQGVYTVALGSQLFLTDV